MITFSESRRVPIRAWTNLSPSPLAICDSLDRYGASFATVRYEVSYELLPEQLTLLAPLEEEYRNVHRHRDEEIRTWYTYECEAYDPYKIHNVAKRTSIRYMLSVLWVNKLTFGICVFAILYPLYLIVWKLCQKPYFLKINKLMLIDRMNFDADEPTTSADTRVPMEIVIESYE